jgi:hypothetical protein
MKKTKLNLFQSALGAVIIAGVALGCTNYLNILPRDAATPASDNQLVADLVTGSYASLLEGDPFGNGDVHGFAFISATNIMSDDADKGSFPLDQATTTGEFDTFTLTSTNQFCNTLWLGHYNGIGAVNQTLNAFKTSPLDTATLNGYKGEVLFIRAYYYFSLVRMYGGVPLILRIPTGVDDALNNPVYKTRANASVVYDSIVQDLQFAIKHLPVKSKGQVGHATKGAAQSLLAKVYLYQQKWASSKAMSDAVIASGEYSLVADYASQFRQAGENGSESIFEIETGSYNNANYGIANYSVSQGVREGGLGDWNDLGWGFNDPTPSLISAYEPGDLRKAGTIIFIDNSGTHKGTIMWDGFRVPSSDSVQNLYYNYKTYTSITKENWVTQSASQDKDRPQNVIILRYADVLLMNAEAALQVGGDALTPLNLVRQRAGLTPKGAVTMDDIKQERHVELAMEDDRFWDLVRWGDAQTVLGPLGFQSNKNELLPIPAVQIELSNNTLTQNPGY